MNGEFEGFDDGDAGRPDVLGAAGSMTDAATSKALGAVPVVGDRAAALADSAAGDIAKAAAAGAAVGGGVPGAVAGATKQVGKKALKNPKVRVAIACVVALVLAAMAMVPLTVMSLLGGGQSSQSASQQYNTISVSVASTDGIPQDVLDATQLASSTTGVPWELIASIWNSQKTATGGKGPYHITDSGISDADAADMTKASLFVAQKAALALAAQPGYRNSVDMVAGGRVAENGDIGWTDPDLHKKTSDIYLAAIKTLPLAGADEDTWATGTLTVATAWRLGQTAGLGQCGTGTTGTITGTQVNIGTLNAEQKQNAGTILAVVLASGFDRNGAIIAIMTALDESGLRNLHGGDRDSQGLFQQRPSSGWGTVAQITDPDLATRAFLGVADHTHNTGLKDITGWESMVKGIAAQKVQRSAFADPYSRYELAATQIVDAAHLDWPATSNPHKPTETGTGSSTPSPTGSPTDGTGGTSDLCTDGQGAGGPVGGSAEFQKVYAAAAKWLGTPYSWGGGGLTAPSEGFAQGSGIVGFDCSSFVRMAYYVGSGGTITLPRVAADQYAATRSRTIPSLAQAQPGDLVFWGAPDAYHVAMYIGGGKIIVAPHTGDVIKIQPIYGSYTLTRVVG